MMYREVFQESSKDLETPICNKGVKDMGQKDTTEKLLMDYNDVFAGISFG